MVEPRGQVSPAGFTLFEEEQLATAGTHWAVEAISPGTRSTARAVDGTSLLVIETMVWIPRTPDYARIFSPLSRTTGLEAFIFQLTTQVKSKSEIRRKIPAGISPAPPCVTKLAFLPPLLKAQDG